MDIDKLYKDIETAVLSAKDRLKLIDGFSEEDINIAVMHITSLYMIMVINKCPIRDKRFPTVMRVTADILELTNEAIIRNK